MSDQDVTDNSDDVVMVESLTPAPSTSTALNHHAGVLIQSRLSSSSKTGSLSIFKKPVQNVTKSKPGRPKKPKGKSGNKKVLYGIMTPVDESSSQLAGESTVSCSKPSEVENATVTAAEIQDSTSSAKIPHRPTSSVWKHFVIDTADQTKGICTICNARVYRGEGTKVTTSSMTRHLRSKHSIDFNEKDDEPQTSSLDNPESYWNPKMKQVDLKSAFASGNKWPFDHPRAVDVNRKIGEMLVMDNLPYTHVENVGFLQLMKQSFPRYKVPGRNYFSGTVVPNILSRVKEKILKLLETAKWFSCTSDIWTSANNHGFISLTIHWISDEFDVQNFLLEMKHFPGSHTAEAIQTKISEILADWGIDKSKVHVIVRDNAPNIANGIRFAGIQGLACYIHTLQLVISDSITSQRAVIDLLAKCRGIVSHVHRAHNISDRLLELQKVYRTNETPKTLVQDVVTRWNSTFYMLQRFLELKNIILLLLSEFEFSHTLSANDWTLMGSLVNLLKPFEEFTRMFSTEHCFVSEVIPSIFILKSFLSQHSDSHFGVNTMKAEMLESMQERFDDSVFENNQALTFATLLDPRYKLAFFSNNEKQEAVKRLFIEHLYANYNMRSDRPSPIDPALCSGSQLNSFSSCDNESSIWKHYDVAVANYNESQNLLVQDSSSTVAMLTSELNMYLSISNMPVFADIERKKRNDPLLWWKLNFAKYPNVGPMIFKYLSCPPSSVYSERLFSEAGNVYEEKRNSLKPENASNLVFLKHNLRALNYQYLD